jgi:hypothetical protein
MAATATLSGLLSGCAGLNGPPQLIYQRPPPALFIAPTQISEREPSATIVVFRDATVANSTRDRWISLNKQVVALMGPLQRIQFQVPPGRQSVAMHCFAGSSWRERAISLEATAGATYYLLIEPTSLQCDALESISAESAAGWTRRTQQIKVGP